MDVRSPSYRGSYHALLQVLEENGRAVTDVRVVLSDPAQVPTGYEPWFASFTEWQWLQIYGAPVGPPFDAAEVVVGNGWCIANSEWGAEDWVFSWTGPGLEIRVRDTGCNILALIASRRQMDAGGEDQAVSPASSRVYAPVRPTVSDFKEEKSTGVASPEVPIERVDQAVSAGENGPSQQLDDRLSPEVLRQFRVRAGVQLKRGSTGHMLGLSDKKDERCLECREPRGLFRCGKCNGSGKLFGEKCRFCDGGEVLACVNPYCEEYRRAEEEKLYEEMDAKTSMSERDQTIALLKAAIASGSVVRFHYRDAKGKETDREAKPHGWRYIEHDHEWAGGGNLCVVAFCHRRREDRFFAIHRITRLRIATGDHTATVLSRPVEEVGGFRLGERVEHPVFGPGEILAFADTLASARVSIAFDNHGTKMLVLGLAKLRKTAKAGRARI